MHCITLLSALERHALLRRGVARLERRRRLRQLVLEQQQLVDRRRRLGAARPQRLHRRAAVELGKRKAAQLQRAQRTRADDRLEAEALLVVAHAPPRTGVRAATVPPSSASYRWPRHFFTAASTAASTSSTSPRTSHSASSHSAARSSSGMAIGASIAAAHGDGFSSVGTKPS